MVSRLVWIIVLYIAVNRYECQARNWVISECEVRADVEAGSVCGTIRSYTSNQGLSRVYASFRGVPYAEQPVGELRFKPLQPLRPWTGIFDASEEGPICPQTEILYGKLMQPHGMSESCIHANIHVPIEALTQSTAPVHYKESRKISDKVGNRRPKKAGLPVFVFVHGGGFAFGSGDADLHGPEYLLRKNIIVITFNYRLNIMGFLSLNTTEVPGNNGLRDIVTLLKWVKANIASFGGNPDEVTLAGQSAGAAAVHLLTLSKAAEGLFKRAICMSGAAARSFYTTSPLYAQTELHSLLTELDITTTDTEQIYEKLKQTPLSKLLEVNKILVNQNGLGTFYPVIENQIPGVTPIIDDDTEKLMEQGRGRDIPILFSFTQSECDIFRNRFEVIDVPSRARQNKMILVPQMILFKTPVETIPEKIKEVEKEYFKNNITIDTFINYCSDSFFMYPAIYAARKRAEIGGAPVYINQFSYKGDYRVLERAFGMELNEATHIEDLTYLFKVSSIPEPKEQSQADLDMRFWLPELYSNFAKTGSPSPSWPPFAINELEYQDIRRPKVFDMSPLTEQQRRAVQFFDKLYEKL